MENFFKNPTFVENVTNMKSEKAQLQFIVSLERGVLNRQAALNERPDFKEMLDAKTIDVQMAALNDMSAKTKQIWTELSEDKKAIEKLRFHLYLNSPHEEVRNQMQKVVDDFIEEKFSEDRNIERGENALTERKYYQQLLHLSTLGGELTRERPDAWHIAYEFNAYDSFPDKKGCQPAVPFNPMENLFENKCLEAYSERSEGNNLTTIGKAVLARLNGKYGEPKSVNQFNSLSQYLEEVQDSIAETEISQKSDGGGYNIHFSKNVGESLKGLAQRVANIAEAFESNRSITTVTHSKNRIIVGIDSKTNVVPLLSNLSR